MESTIVVAATPNLKASIDFYKSLSFKHFEEDGNHYFEDGGYIVIVDGSKHSRNGLRFYKEDWSKEVERLSDLTAVHKMENVYTLNDFSGIQIQLIEGPSGLESKENSRSVSMLGSAAGISLEGILISQMFKVYSILGFTKTGGDEEGSWLTVSNDQQFSISMMKTGSCPHMFYNPSLTYFNGANNLEVISKIRKAGLPVTEEIDTFNKAGIVDNVILRDPGGLGFFVFSD